MGVKWTEIAAEDARLRTAAEKAGEALARLRYDNTLAIGVSFVEYAKHCEVDEASVRKYALTHQRLTESEESSESFDVAMVRATNTADRAAAVEAVAKVQGISPRTADNGQHRQDVARVRQVATAAAERKGTSVSQEVERAAKVIVGGRKADQRRRETKKAAVPAYFIIIDNHLDKAKRALTAALNDSHDIEWDEEYREMIVEALAKVKAVIGLLDMRFEGLADVDWDAELARIGGAE